MDDQGRGRSPTGRGPRGPRHAAGPASGPQPSLGPGSGSQRILDSGSGQQQALGGTGPTGPPRPLSAGNPVSSTGGMGAMDPTGPLPRTPVRGFPPGRGQADEQAASSPAPQDDDLYVLGDGYPADDVLFPQDGGYIEGPTPDELGPVPGTRMGRRAQRREPRARGGRFRLALIAVGVLVLGGAALAVYKYFYEPRVNAPVPSSFRLPTTSQASPDFDQALGKWQHIGTRAQDRDPLTIDGLYPVRFELSGASFTRTAASLAKDCTLVVYGSKLQARLDSGHCSQVVRASYVSGKMMGTIGVVNLISATAAQKAGDVTGPTEIIAPLSSAKGVTAKLGEGTGVVQAEVKGHYLILIWAEFTDLKSPSTSAATKQLETFATNLVTGSANINLSTRMLTGKG